MTHFEATKSYAAEKYILHELSPAEELQFEEHFFECEECAAAVQAGQLLTQHIRPLSEDLQ